MKTFGFCLSFAHFLAAGLVTTAGFLAAGCNLPDQTGGGLLPAPKGLWVGNATRSSLTVHWNATADQAVYQLFRATSAEGPFTTQIWNGPAATTSYTDTGLTPATTFFYAMNAVYVGAGTSPLSAVVSGTTLPETGWVVTTLAGAPGVTGWVDGTGSGAGFNAPWGMVTNGIDLFVADGLNHTLRRVGISTAAVTTLAGSARNPGSNDGTGSAARFNYPGGMATDGTYLYVTDQNGSTIRKILISTGEVTTFVTVPGIGIATDGTNLYVADYYNSVIYQIVIATGAVTTLAGSYGNPGSSDGTGSAAQFFHPYGVATDGTNVYVADQGNHKIRQIVISTGEVTTVAGNVDNPGSQDGIGSAASFRAPNFIATDGGTNLFVTDNGNVTVRQIVLATREVTTRAGGTSFGSSDGRGDAASFNNPAGIVVNNGSLFVADYSTIRKVTP